MEVPQLGEDLRGCLDLVQEQQRVSGRHWCAKPRFDEFNGGARIAGEQRGKLRIALEVGLDEVPERLLGQQTDEVRLADLPRATDYQRLASSAMAPLCQVVKCLAMHA